MRPAPTDLALLSDLAGIVPTITVVHGASAGHGALTAPLCDFVIMVVGGPNARRDYHVDPGAGLEVVQFLVGHRGELPGEVR